MASLAKLWAASLCWLLVPATAKGTAIAIMVTADRILIAADSAGTMTATGGVGISELTCKIRQEGSVFYTAAGYYEIPELGFNLWSLGANSIRKSRTMTGIYDLIERSVLDRLPAIVDQAKVGDPISYARWLKGVPVIEIAFASFEKADPGVNGAPRVVSVAFRIDRTGAILKPERHTMGGTAAELEYAFLGTNEQMVAATDPQSAAFWRRLFISNPVGFTARLVQLEIDAATRNHTGTIGPPTAVLSVTSAGGRFEPGRNGACHLN